MPDGLFLAEVVTPEASLLSEPAHRIVLRSSDGDLTVLDGHTRLVSDVIPGEVRVEVSDGTEVRLAVHGGYLQVDTGVGAVPVPDESGAGDPSSTDRSTKVTLLAGMAERAQDIDTERAERARDEAVAALASLESAAGRGGGDEGAADSADVELAEIRAALRRAEVRLAVASSSSTSS